MHRPEYNEQARNHCLLGATNPQLAEVFDVSPRTIDSWIASIPEFGKAVREGRAVANAQVARSLYERAIGFQHTVKRTVLHLGQERTITNTVQFPPDTRACIFWLRNRCPENWDVRPARLPHDGADHSEALLAELDAAGERARASREGD